MTRFHRIVKRTFRKGVRVTSNSSNGFRWRSLVNAEHRVRSIRRTLISKALWSLLKARRRPSEGRKEWAKTMTIKQHRTVQRAPVTVWKRSRNKRSPRPCGNPDIYLEKKKRKSERSLISVQQIIKSHQIQKAQRIFIPHTISPQTLL